MKGVKESYKKYSRNELANKSFINALIDHLHILKISINSNVMLLH